MNPINLQFAKKPFIVKYEIGSSSKPPIGSSRSLDPEIGSDRRNLSMNFASINEPRLEQTITDPHTKDTYLLNLEIGSFSNGRCPVFRALFSKYSKDDGVLVPSGYVTLKIVNMNRHDNEFNLIRCQAATRITRPLNPNIIVAKRTFIAEDLFCVSLPYMSEGSLRSVLSTRPKKKLPEEFISVVLKKVVVSLREELHLLYSLKVHETLNAGDIFVHIDEETKKMSIKLAFEASVYDCNRGEATSSSLFLDPKSISTWGAAPEVFESENENNSGPKSDIWLLGITALELAYGNLPVKNRGDLNYIIKKIRKKKKFPKSLKKMMKQRDGKFKKVMNLVEGEKKVFSEEFEEMVRACLRENPTNRPSADELLNTPFFSAMERFKQFVLNTNN